MEHIKKIAIQFCNGIYSHRTEASVWPLVMSYIHRNFNSIEVDRKRVHVLWTVNGGHIRKKVSNDALLLSVLLETLPVYKGAGKTLYRGECQDLYRQNKIGFCWTPNKDIARRFASGLNAIESGGVLLQAYASESAIISEPNNHSKIQMQEFEYTCNPNIIQRLKVIEEFEKCT